MLLRRHKINAVRQGDKLPEKEQVQQEQIYGDELKYEPEEEKHSGSYQYTRTYINRMSTADLQALATEKGIANADSLSGAEIKKMLIELMSL